MVELFDETLGERPELGVEFGEVLVEKVPLELVFDRSGHKAAQPSITHV